MRSEAERNRQPASVAYGNRRYIKKGVSPDTSSSNHELLSHIGAHLQSQHRAAGRSVNNFTSTSKLAAREQFINFELLGISNSRNNISDQRKKGKSSYYKKAVDTSSSQLWQEHRGSVTQQLSKQTEGRLDEPACPPEVSQSDIEELHYKMVQFQQRCKKKVMN